MQIDRLVVAVVGFMFGAAMASAADAPIAPPTKEEQTIKMTRKKPMKMDEPIANGMKKEGMMKGDVKKSARKRAAELQPMMKQEEELMPSK
jgi:hypothetical protein